MENDSIPGCEIVELPQDGDCFYEAVNRAYSSSGLCAASEASEAASEPSESAVKRLRRCVSKHVDESVFDDFAMLYTAGLDDYSFMRRLPDAKALRARLCVSGAESGTNRCVWANDFEITTLCEVLKLTALIVDAEATEEGRFVALPPLSSRGDARSRCYVVLLRSDRHHFNLGAFELSGIAPGCFVSYD